MAHHFRKDLTLCVFFPDEQAVETKTSSETGTRPVRVLLVSSREEDFFQIREILGRHGSPLDAELDHARSLEEAKLLLGQSVHDLVLFDYEDGGTAAVEMLSKFFDAGFAVPFVFLTEHADEHLVSEIIRAGAWDYLDRSQVNAANLGRALRCSLSVHALQCRQRSAEQRLGRLSQAVEQSADSVIITDRAGRIEYVNPAFEELNGYACDEVLGKNPRLLNSGETDPAVFRDLWKTILSGSRYRGTMVNRKRNGEIYQLEQSISPVRDERGKITHFVANGRDLSERQRLEGQLLQAQKMDAIGCLAGGVAHDFNNLLTIITSYAEMALDEAPAGSILSARVKEVLGATQRASDLTRQLLAFSRKQPQSLHVLDLNQVVTNVAKTLGRLVGEDVELTFVADAGIGQVRADPVQIEQILMNLAANARDAMPQGGKLLLQTQSAHLDDSYVGCHRAAIPIGDYVLLSVQDTGCGIPAKDLPRVFEPFYTTKPVGEGTGLGLATVYGIVKQSSGFVWAYSEMGMGTVFKIYLPCVRSSRVESEKRETNQLVPHGCETILVVEDETAIRTAAAEFLATCGYTLLTSSNGREALTVVRSHPEIGLIVTDVVMPEISGGQLAQEARALLPHARTLFVSGYPGKTVEGHQVELRESNFLQKPFSLKQLARSVRKVLDQSVGVDG
jgi:two-component system cell cycle sensor histidine kinase/response regulator CckA